MPNDNQTIENRDKRHHAKRVGQCLAIAQAKKMKFPKDYVLIVNLSGRGDKDVTEVIRLKQNDAH